MGWQARQAGQLSFLELSPLSTDAAPGAILLLLDCFLYLLPAINLHIRKPINKALKQKRANAPLSLAE